MNPVALLIGLIALTFIIFLITNILYPVINKDVEFFWFFKTDWFERNSEIKKKEERKRKRKEKKNKES